MTKKNNKDMTKPTIEQVKEAFGVITAHLDVKIVHDQPEPEPVGEEPTPGTVYHNPAQWGCFDLLLWGGRGKTIDNKGDYYEAGCRGGFADKIRSGTWPKIATLTELVEAHRAHRELVEAVRAFLGSVDKAGNSWEGVCNDYGNYPHLHTTVDGVKRLYKLTSGEDQP